MINEIGSELIVTGFLALIHHLWSLLSCEELDEEMFSLEFPEKSELEYQQFIERFATNWEEN